MRGLEAALGVPVVEAYGMTEASHQICSNPLPPGVRKPGAVGLPAGPEVAIMDEQGNLLPAGERGEVVIRGRSVTAGYENNPEANRSALVDGWFRTGDQASFDAEGYLFLSGRIKELINRGGEKISPREIDEVLLEHPAVAQAVAFAVPHATLGEDVAAAVVLRRMSRRLQPRSASWHSNAWPPSRSPARSSSSLPYPKARRASSSASDWQRSWPTS